MKKEKGIIDILKHILTWQGIGVIVAIVSLTFVIIDHTNKKDEVEIIRDSVVASISKIDNDFHPDQIVLSGNNSVDSLIVVFPKDALTICSIWKSLDNMQEFNGPPTNSSSLLKYYMDMFHELSTYESKVLKFGK